MTLLADTVLQFWASFLWPFARIAGMLMTMTAIGAAFVSARVRLLLAVAITLVALPSIPAMPQDVALFSFTSVVITAQQIAIGVAIGMLSQFVSQTFVILGQIISMQSSLGFASMVDPASGQSTPLLGQIYMMLTLLVFLTLDGHLIMIEMLVHSFSTLPVGESGITAGGYRLLAQWFGTLFLGAVSMSLSAIISLLTVNIAMGIMNRAAPQLNVYSLGFGIILLCGLFSLWFLLSAFPRHYNIYWRLAVNDMCTLLNLSCPGG
ncbi:MAG: flagellar biosynthetic protein FliR [Plesiomonas sp.]|uniref:flagellar biosynthetic protein FliR n=1 Tax=Plesiomonas sp. TaxID=2486279 RepID=UPI003EE4D3A6